jgi:hypothetical protein
MAHTDAACHLLLEGDLAGDVVFAGKILHEQHQAIGAAGKEGVCPFFRDQPAKDALDVADGA